MNIDHSRTSDDAEKWEKRRLDRCQGFIEQLEKANAANLKGLEWLENILMTEDEKVRIGIKDLIIEGNFGIYTYDYMELIGRYTNVFSAHSRGGMPEVEVHPRGRFIKRPGRACIQSDTSLDRPGIDSMISIIRGLMNDQVMFKDSDYSQLRDALFDVYGFFESPISDVFADWLSAEFGAINDTDAGEITLVGSDGWSWFIDYSDAEVAGFRLSSSIRNGPRRLHLHDTSEQLLGGDDMELVLRNLKEAPRSLLDGNSRLVRRSPELVVTVANVWAPLRREIEETGLFEEILQECCS